MAILTQYVKSDGTGDYTDLFVGVSGILASGLSMSGYYTEFQLYCDSNAYTGSFDVSIPYSGTLTINGSNGSLFLNDPIYISGCSPYNNSNLNLENFTIFGSGLATSLHVRNNTTVSLKNVYIIASDSNVNTISNSGYLIVNDSQAIGPSGAFVNGPGIVSFFSAQLADFDAGIMCSGINLSKNTFTNVASSIINSYSHGNSSLDECIIYGATVGISGVGSSINLTNTSIKAAYPILTDTPVYITNSNISGSLYCISSSALIAGLVKNTNMYPSGCNTTIINSGVQNQDPSFNNPMYGDLRLKFGSRDYKCVEFYPLHLTNTGVTITTYDTSYRVYDAAGMSRLYDFQRFVYRQDNTLLFSDYDKEIEYADIRANYNTLAYEHNVNTKFKLYDVPVQESFGVGVSSDEFPWDFDYKDIVTQKIEDNTGYIIPKSIAKIGLLVHSEIGQLIPDINKANLSKRNIKCFNNLNYRGVAFDVDASYPTVGVLWIIEANNQLLLKKNQYTGELIESYPLLCQSKGEKYFIKPSGIIPIGAYKDSYRYALEQNPTVELLGNDENRNFQWLATTINPQYDIYGLYAYKDNLYITTTEYSKSIYNRTVEPTLTGVGLLLRYDNNNIFHYYTENYTTNSGISVFMLASGNVRPTDITVSDDGYVYIGEYSEYNTVYKYRFGYDYALIASKYDEETLVYLRENYDNVET